MLPLLFFLLIPPPTLRWVQLSPQYLIYTQYYGQAQSHYGSKEGEQFLGRGKGKAGNAAAIPHCFPKKHTYGEKERAIKKKIYTQGQDGAAILE